MLLLLLLPALVWVATLTFDFVLDDIGTFVDDPLAQGPLNLSAIFGSPVHVERGSLPFYRPVVTLSYWIDRFLWGLNPAGFHLTNIAWHALNVLLAYALLRLAGAGTSLALTASTLFAVLPSHAEAVAWIQGRVDLIASAFFLAAACVALRLQERPTLWRWIGTLLTFALALLAKEPAVVLPGVLVFLWRIKEESWKSTATRLAPFLAVLGAYLGLRQVVLSSTAGFVLAFDQLPARATGLAEILLEYFRILIWPGFLPNFHMAVSPNSSTAPPWMAAGLIVLVGLVLTFAARRRDRSARARSWFPAGIGVLWFAGTLLPALGIVWAKEAPQAGFLVTERYVYLPALGLCVAAAWGLSLLASKPGVMSCVAVLVLLLASGLALVRAQQWRDAETMYRAILPRTGDRALAHANLGALYLNRGETHAAIAEFEAVLHDDPANVIALNNLGVARARQGRTDDALALYREAIRRKPLYADAWNNLGLLLEARGERDEARSAYRKALTIDPALAQAQRNLQALGATAAGSGGEVR
jgi:TolA-binding protein